MACMAILILFSGCERKMWDEHYQNTPETVDQDIWEVIQANPDFSSFTGFVKEFKYDSLFKGNDSYTLFIPANELIVVMQHLIPMGRDATSGCHAVVRRRAVSY